MFAIASGARKRMAQIHQLLPNRAFGVTSCNNISQVIIDWSCLVSWCGCCDDILLWLSISPTSLRGVRLQPCTLIRVSRILGNIRNTACDRRYTHVSRSRVSMSPSSCLTSLGSLPRPRAAPLDLPGSPSTARSPPPPKAAVTHQPNIARHRRSRVHPAG